eukprot:6049276-Pyramimonas_sp.AAC.1
MCIRDSSSSASSPLVCHVGTPRHTVNGCPHNSRARTETEGVRAFLTAARTPPTLALLLGRYPLKRYKREQGSRPARRPKQGIIGTKGARAACLMGRL